MNKVKGKFGKLKISENDFEKSFIWTPFNRRRCELAWKGISLSHPTWEGILCEL